MNVCNIELYIVKFFHHGHRDQSNTASIMSLLVDEEIMRSG